MLDLVLNVLSQVRFGLVSLYNCQKFDIVFFVIICIYSSFIDERVPRHRTERQMIFWKSREQVEKIRLKVILKGYNECSWSLPISYPKSIPIGQETKMCLIYLPLTVLLYIQVVIYITRGKARFYTWVEMFTGIFKQIRKTFSLL